MTILLKELLFVAVSAVTTALLLRSIRKKNLELERRSLQLAYVAAAFVLAIVFSVFEGAIVMLLDAILSIKFLSRIITWIMPQYNYGISFMLIVTVYLNIFYLSALDTVLAILKRRLGRKDFRYEDDGKCKLGWMIINHFYASDEDGASPRTRSYIIRSWLSAMKNVMLGVFVACCIVMILLLVLPWSIIGRLSEAFFVEYFKTIFLLSLATYAILYEAESFLTGPLDDGFGASFESSAIKRRQIGDYHALLNVFRQKLPTSLITIMEGIPAEKRSLFNTVDNQQRSECPDDKRGLLTEMTENIKRRNAELSDKLTDALICMLRGQDAMIVDSAAGEAMDYVCEYLDSALSQESRLLVVCDASDSPAHIADLIREGFTRVNTLNCLWQVVTASEAGNCTEFEVMVCRDTDLTDHRIFAAQEDFFRHMRLCLFTNAIRTFSRAQYTRKAIINRVAGIRKPQYIFLSTSHSRDLETSVESDTGSEIKVFSSAQVCGGTDLVVWKDESYCAPEQVLGVSLSNSLGTALPIALLGIACGVQQVDVLPGPGAPFYTYREVLRQNCNTICRGRLFSADSSAASKFDCIRYNGLTIARPELAFIMAYDTDYNMISRLDTLMRLGGTAYTMLNIISPPYMLREYYAVRLGEMLSARNISDIFVSFNQGMCDSEIIAILMRMHDRGGMNGTELRLRMDRMGMSSDTPFEKFLIDALEYLWPSAIRRKFSEHFSYTEFTEFFPGQQGGFVGDSLIKFTDNALYSRIIGDFGPAAVTRRNTSERIYLGISKKDIYSYYLPNQMIVLEPGDAAGGISCRILSIDDGTINVEDAAPIVPCEYRQFTSFKVLDRSGNDGAVCSTSEEDTDIMCGKEEVYDYTHYSTKRLRATVERTIYGYAELTNGVDLVTPGNTNSINFGEPMRESIEKVDVLRITVGGEDSGAAALTAATLAILMNGAFKTMFPSSHKCIHALVDHRAFDGMELSDTEKLALRLYPRADRDASAPGANVIDIVEFSNADHCMIQAVYSQMDRMWRILNSYLEWALAEDSSACWLKFGSESYPPYISLESAYAFTSSVVSRSVTFSDEQNADIAMEGTYVCSFCGKMIYTAATMLDEGAESRVMCHECANATIKRQEEVDKLFADVAADMQEHYGIKLPRNIAVKFRSAHDIRRKTGHSGDGRVLGFYRPLMRQLWVERGGPRASMMSTLFHELTHAWQFDNLKMKGIDLQTIEGHSSYVEVEMTRVAREPNYADFLESDLLSRDDEYGRGYAQFVSVMAEADASETEGGYCNVFQYMKENYHK